MNKKIYVLFLFGVLISLSFVSAGLYQDDNGWHYSADSYGDSNWGNSYKETTEYIQTTTSISNTKYGYEKITTNLDEKTTIEKRENPYFSYNYYNYNNYGRDNNNKNKYLTFWQYQSPHSSVNNNYNNQNHNNYNPEDDNSRNHNNHNYNPENCCNGGC